VFTVAKYVRKVQLTGKSTFIVSLPKNWATRHGISQGSQVVVEEVGPYLVIKPFKSGSEGGNKVAVVQVRAGDTVEAVVRRVIGAYVVGFEKVLVKSETAITPMLRNAVRETILSKLPGMEIIAENEMEIEVQVLLNPGRLALLDTVKRLARVVQAVLHDSCNATASNNVNLMKEIAREDDNVDRVFLYSVRLINQAARGDTEETVDIVDLVTYRALVKLLERIGDHAVNIAVNAVELGGHGDLLNTVSNICYEALRVYNDSVKAFFERNPYAVEEISSKAKELWRVEEELLSSALQRLGSRELIALKSILESIRRVVEYSRDIGELALDMGISRVLHE